MELNSSAPSGKLSTIANKKSNVPRRKEPKIDDEDGSTSIQQHTHGSSSRSTSTFVRTSQQTDDDSSDNSDSCDKETKNMASWSGNGEQDAHQDKSDGKTEHDEPIDSPNRKQTRVIAKQIIMFRPLKAPPSARTIYVYPHLDSDNEENAKLERMERKHYKKEENKLREINLLK